VLQELHKVPEDDKGQNSTAWNQNGWNRILEMFNDPSNAYQNVTVRYNDEGIKLNPYRATAVDDGSFIIADVGYVSVTLMPTAAEAVSVSVIRNIVEESFISCLSDVISEMPGLIDVD
jgi:F420-dependent methylenetetrahydromethanopterin dehydrogenase